MEAVIVAGGERVCLFVCVCEIIIREIDGFGDVGVCERKI